MPAGAGFIRIFLTPGFQITVFDYNRRLLVFPSRCFPHFLMPTYDYRCDSCSYEFEEFQYINDDPLVKCPHCGKKKLRRLIGGGAAIVFRGNGFYQTDYRSDSYRNAAKADSTPKSESTSSCKGCPAAKECDAKS